MGIGNLNTLHQIVKEIAKDVNCEFAGAVLRPHSYLMRTNLEKVKEVKYALRQVGYDRPFKTVEEGVKSYLDILNK